MFNTRASLICSQSAAISFRAHVKCLKYHFDSPGLLGIFPGFPPDNEGFEQQRKKTGFGVVGMMILTHKWWRARAFHGKSVVKVDFSCLSATQDTHPFSQVLSLSTKKLYHSLKSEKEDCSCTSACRAKASVWSWRCSSFPTSDQQVMNVTFVLYVSTKSLDMTFLFQGRPS